MSRFISTQRANPYVHGTREWRAYEALAGNMIGAVMCNATVKGGWIKRTKRSRVPKARAPENKGKLN